MERQEGATAVSLQLQGCEFILHDADALLEQIQLATKPVALMYIPALSSGVEECTMKGEAFGDDETTGIGLTSTLRIQRKESGPDRVISSVSKQLHNLYEQPVIAHALGFTVLDTPAPQALQVVDSRNNAVHLITFNSRRHTIEISNHGSITVGDKSLIIPPTDSREFDMVASLEAHCRLLNFVADSVASFQEAIPGREVSLEVGKALPISPRAITAVITQEVAIHTAEPTPSAFDDIGGLMGPKQQLRELAAIYRDPELLAQCAADLPRGILLYGPAGTGKTALARAFAAEVDAELIEVNDDEFDSKWVSEGARNLRNIFEEAKEASDLVVLLFDELESTIPNNSQSSHDNQLNGVFKQEIADIAQNYPHVLVVATTNRDLQTFDKSLIRSGRFDLHIPVLEPTPEERIDIFGSYMYAMAGEDMPHVFSTDINLPELAKLTDTLTGADISAIFRGIRFKRKLRAIRTGTDEPLAQQDFVTAIREYRRHLL